MMAQCCSRDEIDLLKFNSFELSRARYFGYSFFLFFILFYYYYKSSLVITSLKWKTMNRHEERKTKEILIHANVMAVSVIPTRIVGIVQGIMAFALVSTSLCRNVPCVVLYLLAFTVLIKVVFFFLLFTCAPAGYFVASKIHSFPMYSNVLCTSRVFKMFCFCFRLIWLQVLYERCLWYDENGFFFFSGCTTTQSLFNLNRTTIISSSCKFNEVLLSVSQPSKCVLRLYNFLFFFLEKMSIGHRTKTCMHLDSTGYL